LKKKQMASDHLAISGNSFYEDTEHYKSPVFTGTANFYFLNGMQRGTTSANRIGQQIRMKRLRVFGWAFSGVTTGLAIRVGVVVDRYNNGAASVPAVNTVFLNDNAAHQAPNPLTSSRYEILHDELILPSTSVASVPLGFSIEVPLDGWITTYNTASTGLQSDIQTNALFFFLLASTVSTGAAVVPSANFSAQLTWEP